MPEDRCVQRVLESVASAWIGNRRLLTARWSRLSVLTRDAVGTALLAPVAFLPAMAQLGAQFGDLPQRPYDPLGVFLTAALWVPVVGRQRVCGAGRPGLRGA